MIQDFPNELSRYRLADQQLNQELIAAQNVKTCIEAEFPNAQWLVTNLTDQQRLKTRALNEPPTKATAPMATCAGATLQLGRGTAFFLPTNRFVSGQGLLCCFVPPQRDTSQTVLLVRMSLSRCGTDERPKKKEADKLEFESWLSFKQVQGEVESQEDRADRLKRRCREG